MAWTSPRTWVSGETVTAALMNTHVRDNLKAVGDAWTTYTPTWTAAVGSPSVGNGTLTGAYMQAGKYTSFRIALVAGSTTTFGTTSLWSFTLPFAPVNIPWRFQADCLDNSVPDIFVAWCRYSGTGTVIDCYTSPTTAGVADRTLRSDRPFTWATNDKFTVTGFYEAA